MPENADAGISSEYDNAKVKCENISSIVLYFIKILSKDIIFPKIAFACVCLCVWQRFDLFPGGCLIKGKRVKTATTFLWRLLRINLLLSLKSFLFSFLAF